MWDSIARHLPYSSMLFYNVPYYGSTGDAIPINQASFSWSEDIKATPALKNLTLNIPKGSLVGVIGRVGSGKSTLLSAILGEVTKVSGSIDLQTYLDITGRYRLCLTKSLDPECHCQKNILFLKNYDSKLYRRVLENCSLKSDLAILPGWDMTEIGEKVAIWISTRLKSYVHMNLSGGQKQRVSLARAVYQNRNIYLLDDPLNAVDAHVGRHIFQHVIGYPQAQGDISPVCPYMCHNGGVGCQTRVLVTHALSVLPETDLVVVMEGEQDLLARPDGALALLMEEHVQQLLQDQKNVPSETEEIQSEHVRRRALTLLSEEDEREETVLRRRKSRKESERSNMSFVNGRSSMAFELEQVTRLIEEERLELGKSPPHTKQDEVKFHMSLVSFTLYPTDKRAGQQQIISPSRERKREIEEFLLGYMVDEVDLGYNRRGLTQMVK
ncbi:ABCC2 [Cordylochernes scorpioides]|uniref:ABCC2 n=1 Tax=Cordylochernes scorpioides TaxID=51811 RepID=A0ABY6LJ72_9ARAC|nr:ABCC2 [Cordylochernes scorpioides]